MIYGFNAGEAFRIALEIEENGRLFYEKARNKTDDPEVKKIFLELGQEEIKHKERFSALLAELPRETTAPTVWDPQNEIDQYLKMTADMHVFRTAANVEASLGRIGGPVDALNLAIGFEKDSILFFLEMQSQAEGEESGKKIGQLVKEEQSHLKRLALLLNKLTCSR
ncbi:MAG: ferritin family protein [Pseudomonadota bacterium]